MYASGNQPAFPFTDWHDQPVCAGMTLRDYFAARAMQAFLSRRESITCPDEIIAQDAYNAADAMIQARGESK